MSIPELIVFVGILGLIYVLFKSIQLYFSPPDIQLESKIDKTRREAKESGLVLHNQCYREGNEYYILPQYQCVSPAMIKASIRERGSLSCYQKCRGNSPHD